MNIAGPGGLPGNGQPTATGGAQRPQRGQHQDVPAGGAARSVQGGTEEVPHRGQDPYVPAGGQLLQAGGDGAVSKIAQARTERDHQGAGRDQITAEGQEQRPGGGQARDGVAQPRTGVPAGGLRQRLGGEVEAVAEGESGGGQGETAGAGQRRAGQKGDLFNCGRCHSHLSVS